MGKRAAGFLVYRLVSSQIEYLLLKASYGDFHFSPPKGKLQRQTYESLLFNSRKYFLGHVDPGENDYDTAVRETREETGYTQQDLKIHKDMMRTLQYEVRGKPKTTVYFVAQLLSAKDPVLSDEHTEYRFVPKSDVQAIAPFPDFLEMLEAFDAEIRNLHQM